MLSLFVTGMDRHAVMVVALLVPADVLADGGAAAGAVKATETAGWEVVKVHDGITVRRRRVKGVSLHEFQGRGVIEAPPARVLAVFEDDRHRPEWSERTVEVRVLANLGPGEQLLYDRTSAPWPVADRDVVVHVRMRVDANERLVRFDFMSVDDPRVPPRKGVVRMPMLAGHWALRAVKGGAATEVEYQVHADPGGALPDWIVNMASKALPLRTLEGLRRQVAKRRYAEEAARIAARADYRALFGEARATGR